MRSVLGDASWKETMPQDTFEVALLSAVVQLVDRSRQQWLKDLAVNKNLANCARMPLAGSDEGWLSGQAGLPKLKAAFARRSDG